MADAKFDYPTASAPTTTLTLPRGGTMTDDAFVHALNQKIERKKTGRPIVKRNGSGFTQLQFTLRCKRTSPAGVGHETDRADVIEFIDEVVEVTDDNAVETSRLLARRAGLLVGTSAGANVWACMQMARKFGPEKIIATILPDRAERYFSTSLI